VSHRRVRACHDRDDNAPGQTSGGAVGLHCPIQSIRPAAVEWAAMRLRKCPLIHNKLPSIDSLQAFTAADRLRSRCMSTASPALGASSSMRAVRSPPLVTKETSAAESAGQQRLSCAASARGLAAASHSAVSAALFFGGRS
jgi:hypothetical protein